MAQPSQTNQALRRVARTAIQIIAGLSVTTVVQLLGAHIPAAYLPVVVSFVTFAISAAQNACEERGLIPILLPNAHPPAQPVTPAVEATK